MEQDTATPHWQVAVAGQAHSVEVDDYSEWTGAPRSFRCDGIRYGIGGLNPIGRRHVTSFAIEGRPATMTRTLVAPRFRQQLRRLLGGSWRHLPATILAYALGGSGVGGGVAGGIASSQTLTWVIYELTFDGQPRGSWVATLVGQRPQGWDFVDPGGTLPGRDPPQAGHGRVPSTR